MTSLTSLQRAAKKQRRRCILKGIILEKLCNWKPLQHKKGLITVINVLIRLYRNNIFHVSYCLYNFDLQLCHYRSPYKASWWKQFTALLWRGSLSVLKEPELLQIKLIQSIVSHYHDEKGALLMGEGFKTKNVTK